MQQGPDAIINAQQVQTANVKKRPIHALDEFPSVISNSQPPPPNRDTMSIGVSELSTPALADRITGKTRTSFEQTRADSFNRLDRAHCPPLPKGDHAAWISVQAKPSKPKKDQKKEPCEEMTCENMARLLHTAIDMVYEMGRLPKADADSKIRNICQAPKYRKVFGTVLRLAHACLACGGVNETEISNGKLFPRKIPVPEDRSSRCECLKVNQPNKHYKG
ncbi:hypothetical protein BJ741DRAFT_123495 [Chytriomyces cf. hyalinus JEL632]|nr:hypothetical protein BJ741DRAFT_123495 [Chytriomyces cf. hyalinus JEL632]